MIHAAPSSTSQLCCHRTPVADRHVSIGDRWMVPKLSTGGHAVLEMDNVESCYGLVEKQLRHLFNISTAMGKTRAVGKNCTYQN